MDAIVLVGGQGTRLRPLTASRHKSLVPVCNRPAIAFLFDWIRRSGFERVILALGQDNEDLAAAYPPGHYDGIELVLVTERQRLESGGAIRNAVQTAHVEGRFVVLNGDIFVDFDFAPALESHITREADLTLALYPVDDPSSFGVAVIDEDGLVEGFVEKPPRGSTPGNLVNAGVWIFEPGLVDEIPPGAVRVEETLFPSLVARRRRVFGYPFEGLWADIGTPARYLGLSQALLPHDGDNAIAPTATVHAGASVSRTAVGERCDIGRAAVVERSILWEEVCVGDDARVTGSIVADGVAIGDEAVLDGAVVGRGARIGPGAHLRQGTVVEPDARYDAGHEQ